MQTPLIFGDYNSQAAFGQNRSHRQMQKNRNVAIRHSQADDIIAE